MGLRQERLADEIRDILAVCFQGGQMQDPRLENVTITHVKLAGDLQLASVYFRVYTTESVQDVGVKQVKAGLERASGMLRHKLAEALGIRRVPTLRFFYDESIERGSRIEELLARL